MWKVTGFKNYTVNEAVKLVADHLLFFKEATYEVKIRVQRRNYNTFW